MIRRRTDRGQAVVVAVLAMPVILGMVGLALDVGYLRATKRQMETAADSAAIAGALALNDAPPDYNQLATNAAGADGFTNGISGIAVAVNSPPTIAAPAGPCVTQPTSCVEVIITQSKPVLFAAILGAGSFTVAARAVAWGEANAKGCVYLLGPTGTDISAVGSNRISATCGIYVDSNSDPGVALTGANTVNSAFFGVVGGTPSEIGANSVNPPAITGIPPVPDPLANLPIPPISTPCSGGSTWPNITGSGLVVTIPSGSCYNVNIIGTGNTVTFSPGSFGNVSITGSLNIVTFGAGQYGSIQMSGANTTTFYPGQYASIVDTGSNAEIFNAGTYVIAGPGGLTLTGASGSVGNGVTFYIGPNAGSVSYTGANGSNFSAPTTGPYAGILFFQSPANTHTATFTGANGLIAGTLYFPRAPVTMTGANGITSNYVILVAYSLAMTGANTWTFNNNYTVLPGGSPIHTAALVE